MSAYRWRLPGHPDAPPEFWDMGPRADVTGMHQPARCTHCRTVYDLGTVTIEQRYADCSVWRCPGCKLAVDDRGETGWKSFRDYVRLDASGREIRR